MPELFIIIVHHRTPGFLKLCLDSVKQTCASLDYELVVVDSMSTRESRDIVTERTASVQFLTSNENLGFSRGVNWGIKHSSGQYILILNPDIILTDGAVLRMLNFMKKHADVGMLGPQLRNFNNTIQQSYFSFYRPITIPARRGILSGFRPFRRALADFTMADADTSKIQTPDWLMGSALMVSRAAVDQVGLMDERFFMYFEDVDWARRFWHNGYKVVYFPEAIFYHYHQRESKSRFGVWDAILNRKTRWHIHSALKFFLKYRKLAQLR